MSLLGGDGTHAVFKPKNLYKNLDFFFQSEFFLDLWRILSFPFFLCSPVFPFSWFIPHSGSKVPLNWDGGRGEERRERRSRIRKEASKKSPQRWRKRREKRTNSSMKVKDNGHVAKLDKKCDFLRLFVAHSSKQCKTGKGGFLSNSKEGGRKGDMLISNRRGKGLPFS